MTVSIQEETAAAFSFDHKKTVEEVVGFTIDHEKFPFEAEVNIILTDNEGIHEINKIHRHIDAPTDVLSFPMIHYEQAGDFSGIEKDMDNFNPDTGEAILGDIIISVEKVSAQAAGFGHSELREFAFLLVHSMLHLFGYDHMGKEEADIMEAKQRRILEEMNITRN